MNVIKTGQLIAQARTEKKYTQSRLAELVHVASHTVSQWENGHRMPEDAYKMLLCNALDILPMELLTGERIKNRFHREEMLKIMKQEKESTQFTYMDDSGEEKTLDLKNFEVVMPDRNGNLSGIWIPYDQQNNYTMEEIYAMQDAQEAEARKRGWKSVISEMLMDSGRQQLQQD